MILKIFSFTLFVSLNLWGKLGTLIIPRPFIPPIGNSGMVVSQNQASSDIGIEDFKYGW